MVGVPCLWAWSFVNISDFSPVTVFSRIVFPAFNLCNSLIYRGYKRKDKQKLANE